jgi:hypothetical protein
MIKKFIPIVFEKIIYFATHLSTIFLFYQTELHKKI